MAINKYVCSTFEEEIDSKKLIKRVLDSHHDEGYGRKYFEGLIGVVNDASFNVALIDGVVKGTPLDPSPDNPLTKELPWVAFHPKWGKKWKILNHIGYMLVPYKEKLETITPLLSVEFHTREYIGKDSSVVSNGDIQHMHKIRYDQGRSQSLMMTYDPQGAEKRKRQRKKRGELNQDNNITKILDNFEVDQLYAPQLGPAPISPYGISSALTRDVRFKIWEFIFTHQFPKNFSDADFYELSCSFLRKRAGLPQTDKDDLNMMEGFYLSDKVEFIDIDKCKISNS